MGDADANGMVFFDFETGRALKPPVPISFDPDDPTRLNFSAGLREWVKQENMDVLFVLRDRFWHAISLDLEERNLTTALTLDAFKPQEFESLIAPLKGYSGTADLINVTASVYYIPYDDTSRSPSAAFCTRTGTKGLFKWTSVRDPMPGIKVRYRFWRK
jgi:hypothetical protein